MNKTHELFKVRRLLNQLSNYYWTPTRPEYYVIRLASGQTVGLGKIASEDYGLFNLVWASSPLTTVEQHMAAIELFRQLKSQVPVVAGQSLSDWLTQLSPAQFEQWYLRNEAELPMVFRLHIIRALHALAQVRTVRR